MSLNPEFFTCDKCGHQWLFGQHGGHDCSVLLIKALKFEQGNLAHMSKINGELRADLAAAVAERDALARQNGNLSIRLASAIARLAAIEAAPVVATIKGWTQGSYWRNYDVKWSEVNVPTGTELIAKPAKDAQ